MEYLLAKSDRQLGICLRMLYDEGYKTSVYKGYKRDKIEMKVDREEVSDIPLYLNAVAVSSDCQNQNVRGFSYDSFLICWGDMVSTLNSAIAFEMVWRRVSSSSIFLLA